MPPTLLFLTPVIPRLLVTSFAALTEESDTAKSCHTVCHLKLVEKCNLAILKVLRGRKGSTFSSKEIAEKLQSIVP